MKGGATMMAGAAAGAVVGAALGAGAAAVFTNDSMRKKLGNTFSEVPSYASNTLDAMQDMDKKAYQTHHKVSRQLNKAKDITEKQSTKN